MFWVTIEMKIKMSVQQGTTLNRDAWLDIAMKTLIESGIASVSIVNLSKLLGITRGSFYHHFSNREDLLLAMLMRWEKVSTVDIREEVSALDLPPHETLRALITSIRQHHAAERDAPIRAWIQHDPLGKDILKRVDAFRLKYIKLQFERTGFNGLDALNRAQLLLFSEMTIPIFFVKYSRDTQDKLLDERLSLLLHTKPHC